MIFWVSGCVLVMAACESKKMGPGDGGLSWWRRPQALHQASLVYLCRSLVGSPSIGVVAASDYSLVGLLMISCDASPFFISGVFLA